jgi:hypothetical protein
MRKRHVSLRSSSKRSNRSNRSSRSIALPDFECVAISHAERQRSISDSVAVTKPRFFACGSNDAPTQISSRADQGHTYTTGTIGTLKPLEQERSDFRCLTEFSIRGWFENSREQE